MLDGAAALTGRRADAEMDSPGALRSKHDDGNDEDDTSAAAIAAAQNALRSWSPAHARMSRVRGLAAAVERAEGVNVGVRAGVPVRGDGAGGRARRGGGVGGAGAGKIEKGGVKFKAQAKGRAVRRNAAHGKALQAGASGVGEVMEGDGEVATQSLLSADEAERGVSDDYAFMWAFLIGARRLDALQPLRKPAVAGVRRCREALRLRGGEVT